MDIQELKNTLLNEKEHEQFYAGSDFYDKIKKHVDEINSELYDENINRHEYMILRDEYLKTQDYAESIYMIRVRKIAQKAVLRAFSGNTDEHFLEKLHPTEKEIYNSIINSIKTSKQNVLDDVLEQHPPHYSTLKK